MATTQLPPAGPPQDQNPTWPPQQPPQSPPPPYWGPPQPPQQGPPKPHTARNIWLICAGAGLIGAILGGGIASGHSHPAAASTPAPVSTSQPAAPASQPSAPAATVPDAQSVLTADGYTTDVTNESQSQITSTFGSAAPYITSAADGSNGTDIEVVIIETGTGVTAEGGPSALQSDLQAAFPQATVTVTPDSDGSCTVRAAESISAASS